MRCSLFLMLATCLIPFVGASCSDFRKPSSSTADLNNASITDNEEVPMPLRRGKGEDTPQTRLFLIKQNRTACLNAAGFHTAPHLACDWAAIDATYPLLPRTRGNKSMERLFSELETPFVLKMGGGDEADSIRFVATGSFADLAQARASILTKSDVLPDVRAGSLRPERRLGWMKDRNLAIQLWQRIIREDCDAYPVPQCAQRLDAAFADLIDVTAIEEAATWQSR